MLFFCSLKWLHLMKICICPWLFVNHSSLGKNVFPFTENEMQAITLAQPLKLFSYGK